MKYKTGDVVLVDDNGWNRQGTIQSITHHFFDNEDDFDFVVFVHDTGFTKLFKLGNNGPLRILGTLQEFRIKQTKLGKILYK